MEKCDIQKHQKSIPLIYLSLSLIFATGRDEILARHFPQ
jgi:hypothetical protein